MKFNLNNFLLAVSFALDYVERDIFGFVLNHGRRVAYTSLMIGKRLGLPEDDLADLVSLAILHDNGMGGYLVSSHVEHCPNPAQIEGVKEHCVIGEKNVSAYPFLRDEKNVILYHHERVDGSGIFHLKGSEIPLKSQIISLADHLDIMFNLSKIWGDGKDRGEQYVSQISGRRYSELLCDAFLLEINRVSYHLDQEDGNIAGALEHFAPKKFIDVDYKKIREISKTFSMIIDSKSKFTSRHSHGLAQKAEKMADYYQYDDETTTKLCIAADLHDLGKLLIPNEILEADRKLTKSEFARIQSHVYYTRQALSKISGFEDITEWASNHHEKLNGTGYPYGLMAEDLDFNSRLLGCLDIYQALTEDRPYHKGKKHKEVMEIIDNMAQGGFLEPEIVNDIRQVFA